MNDDICGCLECRILREKGAPPAYPETPILAPMKEGDRVPCIACQGKGWYSLANSYECYVCFKCRGNRTVPLKLPKLWGATSEE